MSYGRDERAAMSRDGALPYHDSPDDPNYEIRSSDIIIDENNDQMFGTKENSMGVEIVGNGDAFIGWHPWKASRPGTKYDARRYAPGTTLTAHGKVYTRITFIHKGKQTPLWASRGKFGRRRHDKNVWLKNAVVKTPLSSSRGDAFIGRDPMSGDAFIGRDPMSGAQIARRPIDLYQQQNAAEDMIEAIIELPGALMKMPEAVLGAICGGDINEKHGRGIDILSRRR